MSNSFKKIIISKDNIHIQTKKSSSRKFRRKTKKLLEDLINISNNSDEDLETKLYKTPKEVVSPYDINDYINYCNETENCFCMRRYNRKKCREK